MWKKQHIIDDAINFDLTNKTNGYVLQYDSAVDKFISKPLPTGTGSGATNMSGLSDVDVTAIIPIENDILKFNDGKWRPSASGSGVGYTYVDVDRISGEVVETYEPENITNLQAFNISSNSCTLSWTASVSSDIKDYRIYLGSTLVGTVTDTTFNVTGLDISANNLVVVKSRNISNYEAYGVKINVRTTGVYAYQVSGIGDYVKLPTMSFDAIEIICKPTKATSAYYFDGRDGNPSSIFSKNSLGYDVYGFLPTKSIDKLIVDGVLKASGGDANGLFVPINTKQKLRLEMFMGITDDANIFSDKNGNQNMTGLIYSVKVYKLGKLVAYYDLTESFLGTNITDKSGNGNNGTLGANVNHFVIG